MITMTANREARQNLAQFNVARMLAPIDDPVMEGFRSQLDRINALADQSPEFVWRLRTAKMRDQMRCPGSLESATPGSRARPSVTFPSSRSVILADPGGEQSCKQR
jgi:hypothetical protein